MAVDIYDTRKMLAALEQMLPARTFLLDTFFKKEEVSNTKYVDIDIVKGKRRLAAFVNPTHEGKLVERRGYKSFTYEPPYVKPKMVTTSQDFLRREAGDTIYSGNMTSGQKAAVQLGKDLAELNEMITRREEWMAAAVLEDGKITVKGEGVEDEIDFQMEATHLPTLTGTDMWSDATNSTPINDLRGWRRLVSQDSGKVPTDVIMGTDTLEAFLATDQVSGTNGLFDLRRVNIGQIDARALPDGVIYYGTLKELGLDLWTYDEWYIDEITDTEKPMVPTKKLFMGSRGARTARHYGAIQDLESVAAVKRFPKSWTKKDPAVRYVMVQSAPLVSLHQVDAFLTATVMS